MSLYRAIQMGDWEKAQKIFDEDKKALTHSLNVFGNRSLHIAVGNPKSGPFLEKLLKQIKPDLLPALVNNTKQNALHFAAGLDNFVAAEMLVKKNPNLLFIACKHNYLPIHKAIYNSHKKTFCYLLQMCKDYIRFSKTEGHHSPFEGEKGVRLLHDTILAGFLDEAYNLLKDYPELASPKVSNVKVPLWCIAKNGDAYLSAKRYNFYEKFIYSCMFLYLL
ncbi:putative ankyrin repeat-containing domain-containing protein [Helianthus debilis subsp. tardiflorus]